MPLPRKNVEPSRRRDDDSEDCVVTTRKRPLFDWDDMGLGLEVPLSSSESVYSDTSSEHGAFELSSAAAKRNDVHQPTFEWVRNLIDCRKAKHQKAALDDHGFRTSGKGWLRDQHKALEDGTIPVTFKCIIAASGISKLFNKCRDDFRKPEYRSRYWSWSVNFILLIDYFIDFGNINITEKAAKKYQELSSYLAQCKEQKKQGSLSAQRDQLLTALGMVWDSEESSSDEDIGSSDESYGDSQADETWEMPSKHKSSPRPKRGLKARDSRKRKRGAPTREAVKPNTREESPPPYRLPVIPVRRSLTSWAKQMLEVRRHYRKQRGDDDLYDIPSDQLSLRIWMNAETARCSTGALSDVCCGILKAAEMADADDVGHLHPECEAWAKGFVAFLDFFIKKKKPRDEAVNFLYECRKGALSGTLPADRDAILRGVDENWLDSEEVKACVFIKEKKRSEVLTHVREQNNARKHEVDDFNGQVVEVVLDSGTNNIDETVVRRKRRKTATVVRQMLSSMIGGEVAVTVEGRNPTPAERDAKEWVLRAGAKAFDVYARNWFRAAIAEKY